MEKSRAANQSASADNRSYKKSAVPEKLYKADAAGKALRLGGVLVKNKTALLIALLIIIGLISAIIVQNSRINELNKKVKAINENIAQIRSEIVSVSTDMETQKKKTEDMLSSSGQTANADTALDEIEYRQREHEKRIGIIENTIGLLPDVEQRTAYIRHIKRENGQITVALDFVECFWGEDATKASAEDGINQVFEDTGVYIRNNDLTEELFTVPESFVIYILDDKYMSPYGTEIVNLLTDETLSCENGSYRLFDILLSGGRIAAIEEKHIS